MPTSQQKRQKKLAAKKAKRKSRQKKNLEASKIDYELIEIKRCAQGPVHECYISNAIIEDGFGTVVFSRFSATEPGSLGYALILIDSNCLGVKNCVFKLGTIANFRETLADCNARETMLPATPEKAVKLIEGAISFAAEAGFAPHKDYRNLPLLFADIDPSLCEDEFEYGYEGKPYFFQGHHDSPAKTARILNTLRARFGDDGFHYMVEGVVDGLTGEHLPAPRTNLIDPPY